MPSSQPKTPPPKAPQGIDKSKKRRSARVLQHDPVVAPGFGTRKDLKKLAAELSQGSCALPVEAVEAMMRSRGRGIRDTNETSEPSVPVSNAWADFMKEEGVADAAGADGSSTTAKDTEEGKGRVYALPSKDSRPAKKAKKGSKGGVLVQAGTLDTSVVGRTKVKDFSSAYHLSVPTRVLSGVRVTRVFTSCNAAHSIAVDSSGTAWGWGRNEAGQLGSDLPSDDVVLPEALQLSGTVKAAALGKGHTIFHLTDGTLWSVGLNKAGQCGVRTFTDVVNYRKCVLPDSMDVLQISCGEDFSVALSSDGRIFSTGSSQFGQLGNGSTGEYFITASKLAFENCNVFTERSTFCHAPNEKLHVSNEKAKVVPLDEDVRIGQIVCGKHHTIAVEASSNLKSRIFSWGCGNHGALGHGVQADEYFPRVIGIFSILPVAEGVATAAAGATCSLLRASNGHVYYWGKHRSVGEAQMRPHLVEVLANNGHVVTHCAAGAQTVVCCTAGAQTVAWGQGPHGELGLGNTKSSAKPTFVEKLQGCLVTDLACGYGHTLYVLRDEDSEDKAAYKKLDEVDTEAVQDLVEAVAKRGNKKRG